MFFVFDISENPATAERFWDSGKNLAFISDQMLGIVAPDYHEFNSAIFAILRNVKFMDCYGLVSNIVKVNVDISILSFQFICKGFFLPSLFRVSIIARLINQPRVISSDDPSSETKSSSSFV